eukprot:CAMPEP_0115593014 /NCGR_PEP_ID=MMETSP0272-20121206/11080_1 /TAXON_ID=71861 /ORGANISM="Scrippsiella trochoidea, Strain CCMP3099" /LENGTH=77 /DNA_ID=CAMNT_0003028265 /DNA_START=972 /DNA_END=1205 /DNA_ORIENTATION=-
MPEGHGRPELVVVVRDDEAADDNKHHVAEQPAPPWSLWQEDKFGSTVDPFSYDDGCRCAPYKKKTRSQTPRVVVTPS